MTYEEEVEAKSEYTPAQREEIKRLYAAIERGDARGTLSILQSAGFGVSDLLDAPDIMDGEFFTWTPLHAASYYGQIDVIVHLLAVGGEVEKKDTLYGSRPLAWAAYMGHFDVCHDMVKKYSTAPSARNDTGQTALDLVADPSSHPWTDVLIIDRNKRSHKKKLTPMEAAIQALGRSAKDLPLFDESSMAVLAASQQKQQRSQQQRFQQQQQQQLQQQRSQQRLRQPPLHYGQQSSGVGPMRGVPLGGQMDVRRLSGAGLTLQQQQQQYAQQMLSSGRMALGGQAPLTNLRMYVASVGMVSNDDFIRMILPVESHSQWSAQALNVGLAVKSLNLRLLLKPSAEELRYSITIMQTVSINMDYRVHKRSLPVMPTGPTVYDTTSVLAEGMNAIEFLVQPITLRGVQKPPQTVSVYLNRS